VGRDREMRFEVDSDVQAVLEFMQGEIQACKLVGVAEALPQMARLLWGHCQQEPVRVVSLEITCLGRADVRPLASNGSGLDTVSVGGGSAAEAACS
jgi:hypothetical protein